MQCIILTVIFLIGVNLAEVSYYEILGVSKQSTPQEIRQAYKKLAIKLHPDKNPDSSNQEKFLKVTEAYETLKDPDKRHKYDVYGSQTSYSRKYDYKSQAEHDNLYYNGLYFDDPFVDTLSGNTFYNYLKEGFYFINFYSPFCPPCQNVADHWKKLAEMYKGVVKVGAVNCKYYNSFCYNSMRISSYPTLLFYPNGKNGNYIYYRGDRTLDALDSFVMKYLATRVHVPIITQIRGTERPIAYVLGENRIGGNSLTRIAYQLNGLVTLVLVEDDRLRDKLTSNHGADIERSRHKQLCTHPLTPQIVTRCFIRKSNYNISSLYLLCASNDHTTVVFKYRDISKEIETTEEKELLKEIVYQLPKVELIDPVKLQAYRAKLRSGATTPWVIYFSTEGSDRLEFHQKRLSMPDMHFGEINCDEWIDLCIALQVDDAPAWAVLKAGGAYQRVDPQGIELAAMATGLHSLSVSEFVRILDADQGVWVLLVIPYKLSWNDALEPFTRASIHFENINIQFGVMTCTAQTQQYCRRVTHNEPAIVVQNGTKRTYYGERANEHELIEFIQMLKESADMELTEEQVLEILDVSSRSHTWLVAHLPARCGRFCDQLARQWMKVYSKLRPLEFVRVGILKCTTDTSGFCTNIKMPTARLYPIASGHHFSVNLQQLNEAPYIVEWALERIDDSVQKLNWHSFSKTVIAEELNPTGAAKPWLIYFHSPRCYRCYELYPEFAIAGITLGNAVQLGRVNCITERGICQHEGITSYPSLRLYLTRNARRVSSVITLQIRDHLSVVEQVKEHLKEYSGNSFGVGGKHDEL